MSDVAKRFGPTAITAASSGAAQTIHTVPTAGGVTGDILRSLRVVNTTGSPIDVNVSIGNDAAGTRIVSGRTVYPGEDGYDWSGFLPLAPTEVIKAWASGTGLTITGGYVETAA